MIIAPWPPERGDAGGVRPAFAQSLNAWRVFWFAGRRNFPALDMKQRYLKEKPGWHRSRGRDKVIIAHGECVDRNGQESCAAPPPGWVEKRLILRVLTLPALAALRGRADTPVRNERLPGMLTASRGAAHREHARQLVRPPGDPKTLWRATLQTGAQFIQDRDRLKGFDIYDRLRLRPPQDRHAGGPSLLQAGQFSVRRQCRGRQSHWHRIYHLFSRPDGRPASVRA